MVLNQPTIPTYYRFAIEKIKEEVRSKDDTYMLGIDLDEYSNYIFQKYALPVIEADRDRQNEIEKIIKKIPVTDDFGNTYEKEQMRAKVTIYFKPRENLESALELRPSSYFVHIFPVSIKGDRVTFDVLAEENAIQSEMNMFFEEIERKNKEIQSGNQQLKQQICEIAKQRQDKIRQDEHKFESLIEKISIPLVRCKDVRVPDSVTLKVPEEYRELIPPTPHKMVEPFLEGAKLNAVIQLIDGCCRSWELSPLTYQSFEEEQLRDIILSSLNSVFRGSATGETFSKRGKTDIYLNIPEGNILIAECKFWSGAKKFKDTIDQILNYLTWRNSYGIIINFSKNKGFTQVLETIFDEIPKHPRYRKGHGKIEVTHFVSHNSLPEDEMKLVELHYLNYNLFTQ